MKRRHLLHYAGAGTLTALGTVWAGKGRAQSPTSEDTLTVQWLGHTCFLFSGGGLRVLVNPFRQLGCTEGYRAPQVEADLVLISSQLLDEGAVQDLPGNPQILYQPGSYRYRFASYQGIGIAHDREGGRRFGTNVAWRWTQAGIGILHLGGAAAPIEVEQTILIGRPELVFVPVGGGVKAYNPVEAKAAIEVLRPQVIVPMHYRTAAANPDTCDLVEVEEFIEVMGSTPVRRLESDRFTLTRQTLPQDEAIVQVPSYAFGEEAGANAAIESDSEN